MCETKVVIVLAVLLVLCLTVAEELVDQKNMSKFVVDYVQFHGSVSVSLLLPAGQYNFDALGLFLCQ